MSWQKILAQGFSCADELLDSLNLPRSLAGALAEKSFKVRVPRGFAARMQSGNARDPLLLQVLAVKEELELQQDFVADPLQELITSPIEGLLHKYQGRVLLTLTGTCAVNCRYCFRRHFPYQQNNPGRQGWQRVVDYIKNDASIHEVILSGGDPLLASDTTLDHLFQMLSTIAHVKTLRFHTRVPIVLPERIDGSFLALLKNLALRKVMVLHCNHAQEINEAVYQSCQAMRESGCHLLNQSVLLKGVNDSAATLAHLSEKLFDCGVLPYYLHLLDKVAGAAHFDIPLADAKSIYQELQKRLPGYLLPKLVCEEAGKTSKTLIV